MIGTTNDLRDLEVSPHGHRRPSTIRSSRPRRGKLTLALLAAVAFLDFVDASIVNVALPSIRSDLGFSEQALQWVPSAYLLTYGGFMLLGGRAADLLGRRRVLVAGTVRDRPLLARRRIRRELRACWSPPASRRASAPR